MASVSNDIDIGKADPLYVRQARILERSIRKGLLGEGVVLLEGPLAQILGSSRQPTRRALAQLHEAGLVRPFDGRGYAVGSPDIPIRRIEVSAKMLDIGPDAKVLRKFFGWEMIYELVERTIIHCSAFGKFRVNELELARQFGVGRTVARDVVTRLHSLGMLDKDSRQRWFTVPLDQGRLADLYEVRWQLEPLALSRALPEIGDPLIRQMRARLADAMRSYPDVLPTTMDDLEFDLHVRCLMRCPNKELLSALLRTRSVLTLSKHILGTALPMPENEPFMSEHDEVFAAMLSRDGAAAAEALRRHLEASCPKVTDRLGEFRRSFAPPAESFVAVA